MMTGKLFLGKLDICAYNLHHMCSVQKNMLFMETSRKMVIMCIHNICSGNLNDRLKENVQASHKRYINISRPNLCYMLQYKTTEVMHHSLSELFLHPSYTLIVKCLLHKTYDISLKNLYEYKQITSTT